MLGFFQHGSETDIISNLPEEIVEKILVLLPIKDAVKTSLLSTKWRYKWSSITELVINEISTQGESHNLERFINRFLILHRGPIHKFELSTICLENSSNIDSWLLALSRNHIQQLNLRILNEKYDPYKMPSSLFSCQEVSSMELEACILNPPSTFQGFRNLKTLKLTDMILPNEETFKNMISNCSALEYLWLIEFEYLACLTIRAQNLRHLHVDGYFRDICIVDVPHLTDVYIRLHNVTGQFGHRETFQLINVLGGLIGMEKFSAQGYFLQFLAMFHLPRSFQLPFSFNHLKKLTMALVLDELNGILVTICLFKSAPNLQELDIIDESSANGAIYSVVDFQEAYDRSDFSMNHLKMVHIDNLLGAQTQLEFIRFLLANSPLLEVLSLTASGHIEESMVLKELLSFRRASTNAKILYED